MDHKIFSYSPSALYFFKSILLTQKSDHSEMHLTMELLGKHFWIVPSLFQDKYQPLSIVQRVYGNLMTSALSTSLPGLTLLWSPASQPTVSLGFPFCHFTCLCLCLVSLSQTHHAWQMSVVAKIRNSDVRLNRFKSQSVIN